MQCIRLLRLTTFPDLLKPFLVALIKSVLERLQNRRSVDLERTFDDLNPFSASRLNEALERERAFYEGL